MTLWSQAREIVTEALYLPTAEREAYIAQRCAGDEGLPGDLVETEISNAVSRVASHRDLVPGDRLGPYVITAELGRGGMGVVYRAQRADGQFDQRRADTVRIRAGPAASEAERHGPGGGMGVELC